MKCSDGRTLSVFPARRRTLPSACCAVKRVTRHVTRVCCAEGGRIATRTGEICAPSYTHTWGNLGGKRCGSGCLKNSLAILVLPPPPYRERHRSSRNTRCPDKSSSHGEAEDSSDELQVRAIFSVVFLCVSHVDGCLAEISVRQPELELKEMDLFLYRSPSSKHRRRKISLRSLINHY